MVLGVYPRGENIRFLVESYAEEIKGKNPLELIYLWLARGRDVFLSREREQLISSKEMHLVLRKEGVDVGCLALSIDALKRRYKEVVPVSEAITVNIGRDNRTRVKVDEAWFEARDSRLRPSWNEELCSDVVSPEAALEMAVSYGLSENGQALFCVPNSEQLYHTISCLDDPSRLNSGLISLELIFSDLATGRGWGEHYYVLSPVTLD